MLNRASNGAFEIRTGNNSPITRRDAVLAIVYKGKL